MAELETRGGAAAVEEEEEKERLLVEEVTVVDFDMLCATVAMQTQKGKWGKLNRDNEEEIFASNCQQYGGGVHRMWEGELLYDCFDDRRLALQSACFPCYRFGKNMKRAGFGSCFLQGSFHLILVIVALSNLLAFTVTGRCYFLYLAIAFSLSVGLYLGYHRIQIKKKFNIKGGETCFDDLFYHLICPCCALCQEARTLEKNNVEDGLWHGRGGDTICVGSLSSEDNQAAYVESSPPIVVSPEFLSMEKISEDIKGQSRLFMPPSGN